MDSSSFLISLTHVVNQLFDKMFDRASAVLGFAFLLWPTITEHYHLSRNVHPHTTTQCPTAKTGLLGGGAFLALDSALFWLVSLMLTGNVREDFFEEEDGAYNGAGQVTHAGGYVSAP